MPKTKQRRTCFLSDQQNKLLFLKVWFAIRPTTVNGHIVYNEHTHQMEKKLSNLEFPQRGVNGFSAGGISSVVKMSASQLEVWVFDQRPLSESP